MTTTFRPRTINVHQQLAVLKGPKELPPEGTARDLPAGPTGMDPDSEGETHIKAAVTGRKKHVDIPIPVIKISTEYEEKFGNKLFQRAGAYLRFKEPDPSRVDYELEEDDLEFISSHPGLTENHLEFVLDRLDKAAPSQADLLTPERAALLLGQPASSVQYLWEYWRAKRLRVGKSLLNRLQPPSYSEELARQRKKKAQPVRNDQASFARMTLLKEQLTDARGIAHALIRREEIKRDIARTVCASADLRLTYALDLQPLWDDSAAAAGGAAAAALAEPEQISVFPLQLGPPGRPGLVAPRGWGYSVPLGGGVRARARVGRGGRLWIDRLPSTHSGGSVAVNSVVSAPFAGDMPLCAPGRHVRWTLGLVQPPLPVFDFAALALNSAAKRVEREKQQLAEQDQQQQQQQQQQQGAEQPDAAKPDADRDDVNTDKFVKVKLETDHDVSAAMVSAADSDPMTGIETSVVSNNNSASAAAPGNEMVVS